SSGTHPPFDMGNNMKKQVIFNLPVKDLAKSKAFFGALGFAFDTLYDSPHSACVIVVEDAICAMLITEYCFTSPIDKPLLDARTGNELVICLNCDSKEEVNTLISRAVAAGGRTPHPPEDHGFMYDQGFEDIDGHLWNLVWTAPQS